MTLELERHSAVRREIESWALSLAVENRGFLYGVDIILPYARVWRHPLGSPERVAVAFVALASATLFQPAGWSRIGRAIGRLPSNLPSLREAFRDPSQQAREPLRK